MVVDLSCIRDLLVRFGVFRNGYDSGTNNVAGLKLYQRIGRAGIADNRQATISEIVAHRVLHPLLEAKADIAFVAVQFQFRQFTVNVLEAELFLQETMIR